MTKFIEPEVTADAVRARREETGEGLMEAKHRMRQAGYEEAMNRFRSDATIEEKVDFILDWITKLEMRR